MLGPCLPTPVKELPALCSSNGVEGIVLNPWSVFLLPRLGSDQLLHGNAPVQLYTCQLRQAALMYNMKHLWVISPIKFTGKMLSYPLCDWLDHT